MGKTYLSKKNKVLRKKHRKLFIVLDILMILSIIFNLSCLFLTKYMVTINVCDEVREYNQEIEKHNEIIEEKNMSIDKLKKVETPVKEANPTAAKIHNLPEYSEAKEYFRSVIIFIFTWMIIFFAYLLCRNSINDEFQLLLFSIFVIYVFFSTILDFTNDLGLWYGIKYFMNR